MQAGSVTFTKGVTRKRKEGKGKEKEKIFSYNRAKLSYRKIAEGYCLPAMLVLIHTSFHRKFCVTAAYSTWVKIWKKLLLNK